MSHGGSGERYEDSLLFINAAAGENPYYVDLKPKGLDIIKKRATLSLRRCGIPYSFNNLNSVVARTQVAAGGTFVTHTFTGSYDVYSLIAYFNDYCDRNDYYTINGAGGKDYYFALIADPPTGRVLAQVSGDASTENTFDLSSSTLSATFTSTLGYALGFVVDISITSDTGAPDVPVRATAAARPKLTNDRDVLLLYVREIGGQSYITSSGSGTAGQNPFEVVSVNSGPSGIISVPEAQTRLNMELAQGRYTRLNFEWRFTDGSLIDFNGEAWNMCLQLRVFDNN